MRENIHPLDREEYDRFMENVEKSGTLYDMEVRMTPAGAAAYSWYRVHPVEAEPEAETGKRTYILGKVIDITEQKEQFNSLRKKAQMDYLTKVYNRESIIELVGGLLEQNRYAKQAFLLLDLDHFKEINDTYGHEAGDRALQYFASRLREYFRQGDIVGRLGGDEFVVFLAGMKEEAQLLERIEGFCTFIKEYPDAAQYHVEKCSIGIAVSPEHGRDFEALYKKADAAMYRAKKNEEKKAVLFTEDMLQND